MKQGLSMLVALSGAPLVPPAWAQPNRDPSKVEVAPEHVLVINGRKVFPIGFTILPAPDATTPTGKLALAEFRDAGALFIRTGPMASVVGDERAVWNDDWIAREKAFMDAAAASGMYCAPYLKELASVDKDDPGREEKLRRVVRRFKNHPAMGVWKGADEPHLAGSKVAPLVRAADHRRGGPQPPRVDRPGAARNGRRA